MAKNPRKTQKNPYAIEIDGTVGRFNTSKSYQVHYLLSSIPIKKTTEILETAADAFPYNSVDFEEMIQRDVDYVRVNEMVSNYLEMGAERVLFYPPLIVAIVAHNKGKPVSSYDSVLPELVKDELHITYDKNRFQVSLSTSDEDTGFEYLLEDEIVNYYNYAATIKINQDAVKLVVIDGQHRFESLRILHETNEELAAPIEVPICIVYTPEATTGDGNEKIISDLREMFIRINTTAKTVSGHFIELLKDQSLASITVRQLADNWKNSTKDSTRSKLHLLEWNERSDAKARQRTRKYSVTTISILADVLREHLFSNNKDGIPQSLLRLTEVQSELETEIDAPRFHHINECTFTIQQSATLTKCVNNYLVPALDILLTTPVPYVSIWVALNNSVDTIKDKAKDNSTAHKIFLTDVFGQFRRCGKKGDDKVLLAQEDFDECFSMVDIPEVFFTNVFQQAMLRVWIKLSIVFVSYGLTPEQTAVIIVSSLNKWLFTDNEKSLSRDQLYAHNVLYTNKPNVTLWGKTAWKNIFGSFFMNPSVIMAMTEALNNIDNLNDADKESIIDSVNDFSKSCLKDYLEELKLRIKKDIDKNWRVKDYDKGLKDMLELYLETNDVESIKKFDNQIATLVDSSYSEAKTLLGSVIKIKMSKLQGI